MGGARGRGVVGIRVVGGSGGVASSTEELGACVCVFLDLDQYPPESPWLPLAAGETYSFCTVTL